MSNLDRLFHPEKIAIIGASSKEGKAGCIILKGLLSCGAEILPVNPQEKVISGIKVTSSVKELPDNIDIAIIALNATLSVLAAEECAAKGAAFIVLLAGGFGEIGPEGKALENRLKLIPLQTKTRIMGPNSLGIFFPEGHLDTIFVEHGDQSLSDPGKIAFITQSGSVGVESLGLASNTGFSMRAFVGLGNKSDLNEIDFLDYFAEDSESKCISFYLESLENGKEFLKKAKKVAAQKPIVILKAGRTQAGQSAVSSHTGRLAGSDNVISGAFSQNGIIRAFDDEELCDISSTLSALSVPKGNRIAVITPAGGYGVMLADYIEQTLKSPALRMAKLTEDTIKQLTEVNLPFASVKNPVDITASANNEHYSESLRLLLRDPQVDIVICTAFFSPPAISEDLVKLIADQTKAQSKPVLILTQYGPFTDHYLSLFHREGLVGFSSVYRTVRAARNLVKRSLYLKDSTETSKNCSQDKNSLFKETFLNWKNKLRCPGKPDEYEVKQLLSLIGIKTPKGRLLSSEMDLEDLPPDLQFPVVIKVCSPQILHKTEKGGVILNVRREYLPKAISKLQGQFPKENLLIEEMAGYKGPEFILGGLKDSVTGPAIMLGAGGILTELYKDVVFRLAPCSQTEALKMQKELTISAVLDGYRGSPMDAEALAEILHKLSLLICTANKEICQLDINPLVFCKGEWLALDGALVLE